MSSFGYCGNRIQLAALPLPNYQGVNTYSPSSDRLTILQTQSLNGLTQFTFSNIPATYNVLRVIVNGNCSASAGLIWRMNQISTGSYNNQTWVAQGLTFTGTQLTAGETAGTVGNIPAAPGIAVYQIDFPHYSSTSLNKMAICTGGYGTPTPANNNTVTSVPTSAVISRLDFLTGSAFAGTSTATLYAF